METHTKMPDGRRVTPAHDRQKVIKMQEFRRTKIISNLLITTSEKLRREYLMELDKLTVRSGRYPFKEMG